MAEYRRTNLALCCAAIAVFVGIAATHSVAQSPGCCEHIPKQCEAYSMCFENGFCLEEQRCHADSDECHWDPCNLE